MGEASGVTGNKKTTAMELSFFLCVMQVLLGNLDRLAIDGDVVVVHLAGIVRHE